MNETEQHLNQNGQDLTPAQRRTAAARRANIEKAQDRALLRAQALLEASGWTVIGPDETAAGAR